MPFGARASTASQRNTSLKPRQTLISMVYMQQEMGSLITVCTYRRSGLYDNALTDRTCRNAPAETKLFERPARQLRALPATMPATPE
jgi:hypothetical protein